MSCRAPTAEKDTEARAHLDAAGEIEVDTFHICVKQVGHDTDRVRDWKQKYASFESGIYLKKSD